MANAPLTQTTGRRKEAVARAVLRAGSGKIVVNGKPLEAYFTTATQRMVVTEALRVTSTETAYDISANIHGGGVTGQAGAVLLGLARAVMAYDPNQEPVLREQGMLTRDARKVERKKYGQAGARRRFQFSKR